MGELGSGNGQFGGPDGVAVDASGNVYVADTDNDRIQKFNSARHLHHQVGQPRLGRRPVRLPDGVAIDAAGNVYVADTGNDRIQKFRQPAPETTIDSGPSGPTNDASPSFAFSSSEPGSTSPVPPRLHPGRRLGALHLTQARTVPPCADGSHSFEVRATDAANNTDQSPATRSFVLSTAVDAGHIYWANFGTDTIGRANLDGTGANQSFITGASSPWASRSTAATSTGPTESARHDRPRQPRRHRRRTRASSRGASIPLGVAVDGGHVYWANCTTGTIGRANLDGTGVNQSFITGAATADGVAVDAGHVYWTNFDSHGTIGRANLDGTGADQSFISGAGGPSGVAVDAAHVYWANLSTDTIGRANLDGTGVNQSFITGASSPRGVAVDGGHVYWANTTGTIGRANLDGSGANQSFISGADTPTAVAVEVTGTLDTQAPDTTIDSGPSGPTNDASPSFAFSSSEPGSTFQCRLDSTQAADWAPCTSPRSPTAPLAEGDHTFEVRATDSASNTDQSPASRSFTVDTQAPSAPNLSATSPASPASDTRPGSSARLRQARR